MTGSRVLVVDDFAANRQLVCGAPEGVGLRVGRGGRRRGGGDAVRCRAAQAGTPFDAAVLDMQMPEWTA